ncbi:hypothetical protein [Kitasatospora sp. NPDC096140]|uniref:hypothetical protein n=1 Tax=unclassified Kitasatospora TaxID=2633591 RepID=UPI003318A9EE
MRVITVLLTPSSGSPPTGPSGPVVEDVIWAHARPAEGLEHLTTKHVEQGLKLYFFVRSASETAAVTQVQTLLDRVRGQLSSHGFAINRG